MKEAIIVDLDYTIALPENRGLYECHLAANDKVIEPVAGIVMNIITVDMRYFL